MTDRPSRTFLYVLISLSNSAERKVALGDQRPSGVGLTALREAGGIEADYYIRRYLILQMWRCDQSDVKDH